LDIAQAHVLALQYLEQTNESNFFNLGSETGYTVKQMINEAQEVCNAQMNVLQCDRRPGDVDILVADSSKAKKILGWKPKHSELKNILQSAWEWENGLIMKKYFGKTISV